MKIKVKSINTYEDWERCNLFIKDGFFTDSNYYPIDNIKQITLNGIIIGTFSYKIESNTIAHINHLYIDPSYRGKGIGAKSIKRIKKYYKYKNYKTLTFLCNDSLKQFYLKSGIKLDRESKYYKGTIRL